MRLSRVFARILLLVITLVALAGGPSLSLRTAHAALCTVGGASPTHPSLEAALADPTCDPIQIAPGTYTTAAARVTINRNVSIEGTGGSPTDVRIMPTQDTGGSPRQPYVVLDYQRRNRQLAESIL